MRNLIVILTIITLFVFSPTVVGADNTNCTSQYGGGVVCGVENPPKNPVYNTAIGDDLNPLVIAGSLVGLAVFFGYQARKYSKI